MIIAGVLLPCVPAGVNLVFGHQVTSFSPMVCLVGEQDVGFYTDALLGAFEVAILGTLQALVVWMLVKVCMYQYYIHIIVFMHGLSHLKLLHAMLAFNH